jgi:hypothetical protein
MTYLLIYIKKIIIPCYCNTNIDVALSKMELCGNNNFIYDKSKKLSFYNIKVGSAFTVLAGFNY